MASSLPTSSTIFLPMSYITVNSGIEHGPLAIELAKTPKTRARVPQPARLYNVASAPRPCCIARVAGAIWGLGLPGQELPHTSLSPPPSSSSSSFTLVIVPHRPPPSSLLPHPSCSSLLPPPSSHTYGSLAAPGCGLVSSCPLLPPPPSYTSGSLGVVWGSRVVGALWSLQLTVQGLPRNIL